MTLEEIREATQQVKKEGGVLAAKAIAKTLEEPPEYAVIILLTTNVETMLPTILSRCVVLDMKPVSEDKIKNFLMEKVEIPDYRAGICASFARGNVGKAVMLASNEEFDKLKSEVLGIMKTISDMEVNQMAAAVKRITENKYDINDYLDLCFIWYRDVLLYKACGDNSPLIFKEERLDIRRISVRYTYEGIDCIIRAIEQAKNRLKANVNADLTIELLFLAMKTA